ncbi:hypothetical protein LTR36_010419 [Oleoguttula mirabilis]|uniref:SGS-domain-containing protein n=1 Tax=Oleoguttula mirabilis TaxID=1507867 RepID=A0AAV9J449_9PEZI|nr:hypothetical protein LTR36_010419 [Oleoguttula mirabilis]
MATQADLGKKALGAQDYAGAIKQYTLALKSSPTSPDYLIQRATAYQRAKKYAEALQDAEYAVVNAQKRAKKELIIESQFRRGCALHSLERYGDAELVLGVVLKLNKDHKMANMWAAKTETALKDLPMSDEKRQCTVKETPDVDAGSEMGSVDGTSTSPTNGTSSTASDPTSAHPTPTRPAAPQQTPADKIRYDWYQNTNSVFFTLLAKGVPKDKAQVDITERSLTISFPLITGSSYDLTLDPLFAGVKPADCITRVMPTKVEIVLAKATPGQKWSALESSEPAATKTDSVAGAAADGQDAMKRAILTDTTNKPTAPAYPTSSKNGPKDWDKITKDLGKSSAVDGKKGSLEDDDDYEGGDEANHFFKKLFKGASPEVQRAMMKSYTESNGTALSTNWDEVSKGPVETAPPDGMEAKQWS